MTGIDQVLGDFIDAWNAGQDPDVDEHLTRVPETEREALADAIAMWLEVAPDPEYDEQTRARSAADPILIAALAAGRETIAPWPTRLQRARERAGVAVEQVAERLGAILQLPGQRERTAVYITQAEHGELNERRVSRRLVAALASALGADPDELAPSWGMPAPAAQFYRREDEALDEDALRAQFDALSRAAGTPAAAPQDELDRLFLGGPDA